MNKDDIYSYVESFIQDLEYDDIHFQYPYLIDNNLLTEIQNSIIESENNFCPEAQQPIPSIAEIKIVLVEYNNANY
ncbi:hypothetical protein CL634_09285 [bacterium]|nr:hypothetical protein [bacterium]|tara:strand:+ start:128 stop:355 length:228 start_codon:yes stop_codon:yes gene_type:complete